MSLTLMLDRIDHLITSISPIGFAAVGVASCYYVAFSYGIGVVALTFGTEGVAQVGVAQVSYIGRRQGPHYLP